MANLSASGKGFVFLAGAFRFRVAGLLGCKTFLAETWRLAGFVVFF